MTPPPYGQPSTVKYPFFLDPFPISVPISGKRSADDANMLYENKLLGTPRLRLDFAKSKSNSFLYRMLRVRNDSCEIHEKFHGAIQVPLKTCSFLKLMFRVKVMDMNLVMPSIVVMVKTMEIIQTQLARADKRARQTGTRFQKCRLKL